MYLPFSSTYRNYNYVGYHISDLVKHSLVSYELPLHIAVDDVFNMGYIYVVEEIGDLVGVLYVAKRSVSDYQILDPTNEMACIVVS